MSKIANSKRVRPFVRGELRYLNYEEVSHLTGRSRSTIYRLHKGKQFPSARQVSPGRVAFLQSEVEEWLFNRPTA